jgi:hypothetical protein
VWARREDPARVAQKLRSKMEPRSSRRSFFKGCPNGAWRWARTGCCILPSLAPFRVAWFNEMYGRDRFFVQRGLRREARQTWHGT